MLATGSSVRQCGCHSERVLWCRRTRMVTDWFLIRRFVTWSRLRHATFFPLTSRISSPIASRPAYSFPVLLFMSSIYTPVMYIKLLVVCCSIKKSPHKARMSYYLSLIEEKKNPRFFFSQSEHCGANHSFNIN